MSIGAELAREPYCYLTTTGRVSGRPHTIEIWFAHAGPERGGRLYLCAGSRERADWVRNLQRKPDVTVRIGDREHEARARVLSPGEDEDREARRLLFEKYQPGHDGDLTSWRETALPVAIDLVDLD